jgi:8-oxo-dGTP diphosphatase
LAELAKSVVVALVFIRKEESILLVKQDYGQQYWSLPGGVMEAGESIEQAAVREVREETGLEIRLGRLVGVYSKPGRGELALTFEGEASGGELRADNEIMEARFFPLAELPENMRPHLRQRVADYEAGLLGTVVRTQ